MLTFGILLAHIAELVAAAWYGTIAFCFGIFFWINVSNDPMDNLIWTATCGVVFAVAFLLTFRSLFLAQTRINHLIDTAAREETAAQLKAKSLITKRYPFRTNQI